MTPCLTSAYDQSEANSACMVHAQSTVYEPEFRDAALALEAVGVKKAETFQQANDEFAKTYPPTIYAEKITLPES